MGIYVGDAEIKGIYLGDTPVKEVYVGTTKVRPSTMSAGIYHNATLGLISLSSDGENWLTIADKNLGATTVWNSGDTLTDGNCGKIYQWGNNYGFPRTGTISTSSSKINASVYGPGNYYSSSTFRYGPGSSGYYYWDSSHNTNLWGGTTGTNEAMRGPCDAGFHIPNATELQSLVSNVNILGISSNYNIYLKIPLCAGRSGQNGSKSTVSVTWLWSANSVYNTSHSYDEPTVIVMPGFRVQTDASGNGRPIRPFKNESVQPDSSRTKLY